MRPSKRKRNLRRRRLMRSRWDLRWRWARLNMRPFALGKTVQFGDGCAGDVFNQSSLLEVFKDVLDLELARLDEGEAPIK